MDSIAVFMIGQIQVLPVTAKQVQTATRQDQIFSQVFRYVQTGWPQHVDEAYKPFAHRKQELSIETGCLLWGNRVIIKIKLLVSKRVTQRSPWSIKDEMKLFLVSRIRQGH